MKKSLGIGAVLCSASLWGGPAAKFEKTSFDFGVLPLGSTVTYNFNFQNTGNSPLRIESVQSSCGCTAAAPSNPVVEPGETAQIRVRYDTKGKAGDTMKQIRVRTNDPDHPMTFLTIGGKLAPVDVGNAPPVQPAFTHGCATCPAGATSLSPSADGPNLNPQKSEEIP